MGATGRSYATHLGLFASMIVVFREPERRTARGMRWPAAGMEQAPARTAGIRGGLTVPWAKDFIPSPTNEGWDGSIVRKV